MLDVPFVFKPRNMDAAERTGAISKTVERGYSYDEVTRPFSFLMPHTLPVSCLFSLNKEAALLFFRHPLSALYFR